MTLYFGIEHFYRHGSLDPTSVIGGDSTSTSATQGAPIPISLIDHAITFDGWYHSDFVVTFILG